MNDLITERLNILSKINSNIGDLSYKDISDLSEQLINQFILQEYTPTSEIKEFVNVEEVKKSNLELDDLVITKGYYNQDDGGQAIYIIKDYDYYLNTWLPIDCRKVGYKYNKLGTDLMLMDTPVDEYGNHTINNSLVACLLYKENIYAEQYGAIGDGSFDNSESFIHLFAHMKKGKITFKKDKVYLMPQRNKANIPSVYSTVVNPYAPYMCGRSSGCQRPIMANIDGVELVGENSTLKIKDNDWNTVGSADFALLNLFRVIRNLNIHGIIFDNNGLTMDNNNSVENHGIAWKSGNLTIDGGGEAPVVEDGTIHEISNVEIYNCEFKNGGTARAVNDCGGDGILIINPMENSHDINVHDNKFTNWGRWCFAIDLGGDGERIENVKFNNNTCIQYETNINLAGKFRGLGWIDFEARKCFKNLEICNNYVKGCNGFAFNGNDKVSENIIIKNNTIIRTFYGLSTAGAYPYMWNFYYVHAKNLFFENNDFSQGYGANRLGISYNNAIIRNNKFPNTTDAMAIMRPVGDIIIEGNERDDKKQIVGFTYLSFPNYLTEEDKQNTHLTIKFINNRGGISGHFMSKSCLNRKIDLIIEGNTMSYCNIGYFNSDWSFDPSQVLSSVPAFSARGATFTSLAPYNYRNYPNGGGLYDAGDIISQSSSRKTICTSDGYLIVEGSFKYCDSDIAFTANKSVSVLNYIYTTDNLYIALNNGTLGTSKPSHESGSEVNGDVTLYFLRKIASIDTITL